MLCYIIDGQGGGWHLGETIPKPPMMYHSEVLVQADGHELAWIRTHITNVPIHNENAVQQWYGDNAKFIIDSLPHSH